jgi:hypothetical protein
MNNPEAQRRGQILAMTRAGTFYDVINFSSIMEKFKAYYSRTFPLKFI